MKKILTDEKDIKDFISFFNNINQDFKNMRPQVGLYTIKNGVIYIMQDNNTDVGVIHHIAKLNYNKLKNNVKVQEFIDSISCTINGIELYKFLKEHKKEINKIILKNGNLIINTRFDNVAGFNFKGEEIDKGRDIILYNDFKTRLKTIKYSSKFDTIITKEEIDMIINKPFGYIYHITKKYKLYLSRSVVNPFKGTDVKVKLYKMMEYDDLYLVKYFNKKDRYSMMSFCVIVC